MRSAPLEKLPAISEFEDSRTQELPLLDETGVLDCLESDLDSRINDYYRRKAEHRREMQPYIVVMVLAALGIFLTLIVASLFTQG